MSFRCSKCNRDAPHGEQPVRKVLKIRKYRDGHTEIEEEGIFGKCCAKTVGDPVVRTITPQTGDDPATIPQTHQEERPRRKRDHADSKK